MVSRQRGLCSLACYCRKDCFGETPKSTRETRALPGSSHSRGTNLMRARDLSNVFSTLAGSLSVFALPDDGRFFQQIPHRCLQPAETEIQISGIQHAPG